MTRFEYGMADYREEGTLETRSESMMGLAAGIEAGEFLHEAGLQGWEFCALLPGPKGSNYTAVFKRAIEELHAP